MNVFLDTEVQFADSEIVAIYCTVITKYISTLSCLS